MYISVYTKYADKFINRFLALLAAEKAAESVSAFAHSLLRALSLSPGPLATVDYEAHCTKVARYGRETARRFAILKAWATFQV